MLKNFFENIISLIKLCGSALQLLFTSLAIDLVAALLSQWCSVPKVLYLTSVSLLVIKSCVALKTFFLLTIMKESKYKTR